MARVIVPQADNAERLAAIAVEAFEGRAPWSGADFLALGGPPRAAMITDDACRAGLLVLQFAADEAEILDFGVIPSARRRGLGRELLAAAEALATDLSKTAMFLEVAVDNAPAHALYHRAGWVEVGRRPAYYARPEGPRADALILRRDLAPAPDPAPDPAPGPSSDPAPDPVADGDG
ncbi:MAG: GNAT family N-acetyltransferase [Pseudomonadota bacterium]